MSRNRLLCAALLVLLTSSSGCCSWKNFFGEDKCAGVCGPCPTACHDPYGAGTYFCGKGCGDVYHGDWKSHPPSKCHPCDQCGNWQGPPASPYAPYPMYQRRSGSRGAIPEGVLMHADAYPAHPVSKVASSGSGCACGMH